MGKPVIWVIALVFYILALVAIVVQQTWTPGSLALMAIATIYLFENRPAGLG